MSPYRNLWLMRSELPKRLNLIYFAGSDITIYPTFTKFSWSIDQSIGAYTALGHKQLQLQEVRN